MMRKISILCMVFALFAATTGAQQDSKASDSAAMEKIKISSGHTIIVPRGSKVKRIGAQVIMQDPSEVALEKIMALEQEIAQVQDTLAQISKQIEELKGKSDDAKQIRTMLEIVQQEQLSMQGQINELKRDVIVPAPIAGYIEPQGFDPGEDD